MPKDDSSQSRSGSLTIYLPSLAERLRLFPPGGGMILGKRQRSQLVGGGELSEEEQEQEQEPVERRKKQKSGRVASQAGQPADRCKRGGRTVKRRLKTVRPQQSQYVSDQEGPGDEPLENGFQPAHLCADEPSSPTSLDNPAPEVPSIPTRASHFVLALALAGHRIREDEKSDTMMAVFQLFSTLLGHGGEVAVLSFDQREDASRNEMEVLRDLAAKCALAEAATTFLDFIYMVNCIQLRSKVIRYVTLAFIELI
jgi:hypothetical protein